MSNLPQGRSPQLVWFESRIAAWVSHAAAVGLSPVAMADFAALIAKARAEFLAANEARNASKAATLRFNIAMAAVRGPGRGYIGAIKAFATTTGNPDVLAMGMIDPVAARTPMPPPATPMNVSGTVTAGGSGGGSVTLTWDSLDGGVSSGVFFMIERQRSGESGFTLIGGTQEKSFIDPSPRLRSGPVVYQVRAQRGAGVSAWTVPVMIDVGVGVGVGVGVERALAAA